MKLNYTTRFTDIRLKGPTKFYSRTGLVWAQTHNFFSSHYPQQKSESIHNTRTPRVRLNLLQVFTGYLINLSTFSKHVRPNSKQKVGKPKYESSVSSPSAACMWQIPQTLHQAFCLDLQVIDLAKVIVWQGRGSGNGVAGWGIGCTWYPHSYWLNSTWSESVP